MENGHPVRLAFDLLETPELPDLEDLIEQDFIEGQIDGEMLTFCMYLPEE